MFDNLKNLDLQKILAHVKPIGITAACLVVVFTTGFGAGNMYSNNAVTSNAPTKRTLNNYNTNSTEKKTESKNTNTDISPKTTQTTATNDCPIKGSKSKIYHIAGGSFYDRTNAAQCFATESEAQAAGYTKSSR